MTASSMYIGESLRFLTKHKLNVSEFPQLRLTRLAPRFESNWLGFHQRQTLAISQVFFMLRQSTLIFKRKRRKKSTDC